MRETEREAVRHTHTHTYTHTLTHTRVHIHTRTHSHTRTESAMLPMTAGKHAAVREKKEGVEFVCRHSSNTDWGIACDFVKRHAVWLGPVAVICVAENEVDVCAPREDVAANIRLQRMRLLPVEEAGGGESRGERARVCV